ncbi:CD99 antigen-like protein 2 [Stegostoma tigrinum]|uniref:CD99 antigen-like protein 2 n=1 Tax=Stegostoma tigrinum TaxID=3053191 RepID=UPI00202AFBE7|nr:CD99 antigen-like protein 2 [Stegostoma tigrinum]
MFPSRAVLLFGLAFVFVGTKGQDGFDLADAFKDGPTKAPAVDPDFPDIDLDFDPEVPAPPKDRNNNPDEFDLNDALNNEDKYTPTKLPKQPANGDPDRQFGDLDLLDAAGVGPDKFIPKDDKQESDQDGGNGTLTGIITGVLLALGGGVSSYILYQKKKLCFSLTGNSTEQNTKQENVRGQREDPQTYSTLLQTQPVGSA